MPRQSVQRLHNLQSLLILSLIAASVVGCGRKQEPTASATAAPRDTERAPATVEPQATLPPPTPTAPPITEASIGTSTPAILASSTPTLEREQAGPAPPDFGEVIFYDDFGDPDSGLKARVRGGWGQSLYAGFGQYTIELNRQAGPIYDYYPDWKLPGEFMIEVQAGYEGSPDNGHGLIFQVVDEDQFYAFRISGDGFFTVERADGGEMTPLIEWTPSALIDQSELIDNLLTVEGRGDAYYMYINRHLVSSFIDATYRGGAFGIIAENFDAELPGFFYFDEFLFGTPED